MPLVPSIKAKANPAIFAVLLTMLSCNFSPIAYGQTQSTTQMNGAFTAGAINNQSQVDGLTNPSLASAVASPQCANTAIPSTSNGCVIWDGFNEAPFQAWPFLGDHGYRLNVGHGSPGGAGNGVWATTVPIVLAGDQIMGSGRVNSSEDGSTGTVFRACDGQSQCNGLYFPNAAPLPAQPSGTKFGINGVADPGDYIVDFAWVVNLATGCDSKKTTDWPTYPGSGGAIWAGECVNDSRTVCGGGGGGHPCTWMALNPGTATGSAPPWAGTKGQTILDTSNGVRWYNLDYYDDTMTYGVPGISRAGAEKTFMSVASDGYVAINPPPAPAYSFCTAGQAYADGDYVLDNRSSGTKHIYRAIGSSTATAQGCTDIMTAGAGSQTAGSAESPTPYLWWQEVGPQTNYLTPVGYLVFSTLPNKGSSTETLATTDDCSATVNVGALTACAIGATYNLAKTHKVNNKGQHNPLIDTTHPLVVLGERKNAGSSDTSKSTFMSRISDATLDAGNIAGEACAYIYAQEESGCYSINAISGAEAAIAAIGPGAQNSLLYDFQAGNPASGDYQQQRVAGVFLDGRDGDPIKTVLHGTITPYNNPPNGTSLPSVPYGLEYIGEAGATIESVHTENAIEGVYCDGDPLVQAPTATCNILSTDPASGNTGLEGYTVHLGSKVKTAFVNTVKGGSTHALKDQTAGATITDYDTDGFYIVGPIDGTSTVRTRLFPQGTSLDGLLYVANASGAGAIGFGAGTDLSSGWPANTVAIEGPESSGLAAYRFRLPSGPASGILQGSNPGGTFPAVASTFSGDMAHSIVKKGNMGPIGPFVLCSTGCNSFGLYHVQWVFVQATPCASAGVLNFQLTWTDARGTSHTKLLPMSDGSVLSVPSGAFNMQTSLSAGSPASGDFNVYTDGSPIQYATLVTGCSTGTYDLVATVTQLQ